MRGKKRGSTEIMAIFVFSIILTTATAIMSLVSTDYKMRIKNSNDIQNLYESDSGLNIVYNSIVKNCDSAVVYSKGNVYFEYNGKKDISYDVINEEFKKNFMFFLSENIEYIDDESNIKNETRIEKSIEELSYYKVPTIEGLTNEAQMAKLRNSSNYSLVYTDDNKSLVTSFQPNNRKFEISLIGDPDIDNVNNRITVKVRSTFYSTAGENVSVISKSKKTIETKYIINAPEYIDTINNQELRANIDEYQVQKGIYVDKNLEISNINFNVKGQVWVNGAENTSKYVADKYNNGISVSEAKLTTSAISGSTDPTHICTNSSLHLFNNGYTEITNGNIYATNVYLGQYSDTTNSTETNSLMVQGDVITANDMGIDSGKSSTSVVSSESSSGISIEGSYYGIGRYKETDEINNKESAMNYSSSIIVNRVNKDTDSEYAVDIKGDCYIGGVAYIDTEGETFYKTGESISVISNYQAYTDRLQSEIDDTYKFKEYKDNEGNSINFLDITGNDEINKKAKHFIQFFNDGYAYPLGKKITIGGKINMLGAGAVYVDESNKGHASPIYKGNMSIDLDADREKVLGEKSKEYYINTYGMGDATDVNGYINKSIPSKTVADQVDFSKLDYEEYSKLFTNEYNSNGYAIVGDKNHKITIKSGVVTVGEKTIDVTVDKSDSKWEDNIPVSKILIVTSGDVEIIGEQKIYGCIIAGGNVTVNRLPGDNERKTVYLNQDQEVINTIIFDSRTNNTHAISDAFLEAFKNAYKVGSTDTVSGKKVVLSYSDNGWYDSKTYLTTGLWKLKK